MHALLSALMVLLTGFIHGGNLPSQVSATQQEQVEATVSATPTVSVTPTVTPTTTVTPTVTPTVTVTVTPSVTVTPMPSVSPSQEEMHESEQAKVHEHEDGSFNFGAQISAFVHSLHIGGQASTDVESHN